MKKSITDAIFWMTFLTLCLQTAILKTRFLTAVFQANGESFYSYLDGRIAQRPTIRWLGETVLWIWEQAATALMSIAYWGAEISLRFSGSPWDVGVELNALATGPAVPFVAHLMYYITCSIPIALIALVTMPTPLTRWIMLVLVWCVFVGFPPSLLTVLFDIGGIFVDWPRSYYLYKEVFYYHDYAAFGVIACQILYLTYRKNPPIYEVIVITMLSHGAFEHLGMVFGLAYAARAFVDHRDHLKVDIAKEVIRRLVITALVVIAMAGATFLVYQLWLDRVHDGVDVGVFGVSQEIANNFFWIKTIVANIFTMIVMAALAGALVAILRRLLVRWEIPDRDTILLQIALLLGISMGMAVVFAVGMYTASYPSEMGRQFAPYMIAFFLLGLRLTDLIIIHLNKAEMAND